jgi:hypothetical protein
VRTRISYTAWVTIFTPENHPWFFKALKGNLFSQHKTSLLRSMELQHAFRLFRLYWILHQCIHVPSA